MIRKPQVAGQFYPAGAQALKKQLAELILQNRTKENALGLICPHAGYIYSGAVAGKCFAAVKLTKSVVIIGPNHTGFGSPFSIMAESVKWQTPLGAVEVNADLARKILKSSKHLGNDSEAHLYEHSIEVQLPFLQFLSSRVKIVPIILSSADFTTYEQIGTAIAEGIKQAKQPCLIVASTDMTHYEPQEKAKEKDDSAIQAIIKLNGQELFDRATCSKISICGLGPVVAMLSAAKALGATKARLIAYQTSGDASGDYSSVVGYAGIMVQ